LLYDLARSGEQPRIVQNRLAHRNTVLAELSRFPEQARSLRKDSYWNGSVVCRHAPYLTTGDKNCSGAQLCSPHCSDQTGRTSTNDYDIHQDHLRKNNCLCLKSL
jgi:hypothetical protein